MEFILKKMTEEHISQIAEIEKNCFSEPWSEDAIAEELEYENSHFLVAEADDVVGYIGVQEICGEAYITSVAVSAEYRKSGIGRALIKAACEGARSRNCEFITLEVRESNSAAISLYESENFKRAGLRKNFYSSPTENGIIYTKYFNTEVQK
ncbi:MAG: ribosomal protein S18-alanine N-acetyltransferase [Clostridia bacterium]|nr:ribosomal protein S18-alanine N-acetyltransferase [Clostridia bacterium]